MASYGNTVLTSAGIDLVKRVISNTATFEITRVATSSDSGLTNATISIIEAMTSLPSVNQTGKVTAFDTSNNKQVGLKCEFTNQGLTNSYNIYGVGIYAKEAGKDEILFAVAPAKDPETMPAKPDDKSALFTFSLNMYVAVGQASAVSITATIEGVVKSINGTIKPDANGNVTMSYYSQAEVDQKISSLIGRIDSLNSSKTSNTDFNALKNRVAANESGKADKTSVYDKGTADGRYLQRDASTTLKSGSVLRWDDSGHANDGSNVPFTAGGLHWSGKNDSAEIRAEETDVDNLDLVFDLGDDGSNSVDFRWNNISKAKIDSSGKFTGHVDWANVDGKDTYSRSEIDSKVSGLQSAVGQMPAKWQQDINNKVSAQSLDSNVDMDNLTTAGTYLIEDFNVKNAPISAWFMATVEATSDHSRVVQRVKKDNTNIAYERSKGDAGWTKWERVATETDVRSIWQTMDSITRRVSNAEGNISNVQQTASGLQSTVSNLHAGDRNLARGDASSKDWSVFDGFDGSINYNYNLINYSLDTLKAGDTVTFGITMKNEGVTGGTMFFQQFGDVSQWNRDYGPISPWGNVTDFVPNGAEKILTYTIPITAGMLDENSIYTICVRTDNIPAGGKLSFRYAFVKKGTLATDWTPAPEDLEDSIDTALNTANEAKAKAEANANSIQALSNKIDTKASSTDLASLRNRVSDTESGANTLKGSIASANSLASTAVSTSNTNKGNIEALKTKVENQATEISTQGQKISQNSIKITDAANAISSLDSKMARLMPQAAYVPVQVGDKTDLNNMKTCGFYLLQGGTSNSPVDGWTYVTVQGISTRLTQFVWKDIDPAQQWCRLYDGSNWTTWTHYTKAL